MRKHLLFILSILYINFNLFATTYYVKPAGDDNLDGLSIANAWKTLDKLRSKTFAAGDIILLEGGSTFTGYLFFDKNDAGLPNNPITISSYGTGKATINSGDNYGLYIYNTSGYKITNLIIQGSGTSINFDSGLIISNDQSYTHLDYLFVDNVEVLGYGRNGILIEGRNYDAGFKNITVTNNSVHDNGESGINIQGDTLNLVKVYAHQNVYLANNKVFNTKGITNAYNVTGNGIKASSSNGVTIEYNECYNNGGLSNSPIGGPIGIWVFDITNVMMQYNESHHNKSGGNLDGGGFDLDGGTTNSIMQYNYSHDNDGTGLLLAIHQGKNPLKDNIIRYNISQNDGRKNSYSSVYFWAHAASTGVQNLQFYNNTIYLSPPPSGNPTVVRVVGPMSNVTFRNNIFYSTDWIYQLASTVSSGIKFQGNCYYSSGSFNIWWKGTVYTSLVSWRKATGQEVNGTDSIGFQTDPLLNSPGTAGTVGNMNQLTSITQYELMPTSPLINAGLDLSQFGSNNGSRDYFGYTIKQGTQFDIGANESAVAGTNTDIFVTLTSPSAGTTITTGSSLILTANAASGDASISKIEFYKSTTLLGTATNWPYKLTLTGLTAGSYSITAKAYNSVGASKSSSAIAFTVSTPVVQSLRTPENPENTVSGLDYSYYEGVWTALPDFNTLTPVKTGTTTNFNLSQRIKNDSFAFKFTGYIYVPSDGSYTFYTSSDAGSKLLIGTTLVVSNDGVHSTTEKSGSIGLKAGRHAITVQYFEGTGTEALAVSYSAQGISKTAIPASSLFRVSNNPLTCTSTGNLLREVWMNVTGNIVQDLTENSNFPNNPTSSSMVNIFEGPQNVGDNYGARYRGYLCAPSSGVYTFWIASDNDSELWISSNEDPVNKVRIAYTEGYTNSREWDKYPTQKSNPIFLNKGRYYVEVLHKEGVGEDNMAVGWQLPNSTLERPILGSRLTAFGESINNPPFVSISSPSNGASFIAPASIALNANASDIDGTVTKVEFYQGTTLLGKDSISPYNFNWTNVGAGNYSITAKAFDNSGSSTTSSIISITASGNSLPTVSITSPTNGASYIAPATITINANAADSDGTVSKVEFYQGTTLLGSDNSSPYSFSWTNVGNGNYAITAKAYDNLNATTTSSAINIVVSNNLLPTVSITSPTNGASFIAPATITINSNATDSDGTISKVEFYQGATLLGTDNNSPYSFSWTNVGNGSYSITAKAYDNLNATATSIAVNVTVSNNLLPTVSITSPTNGASFIAPATITINANAADSDGTVSKVEFYQGATLLGTDNSSPYSFSWTNVGNGSYSITAKAYDNLNATTTSTAVNVTVSNNLLPTVSITSPTNGASFIAPATITINANAADSDGTVSKVEFYQGTTLLGTDNSSPYSYTWMNVGNGNYSITAKAYDNLGATNTSQVISIAVNNGTGCTASGTILRELWSNTSGQNVSDIPVNTTPTSSSEVNIFEGPSNVGLNYGARYRGYICVPMSGSYTFWISSNDNSELWLSTDDNPGNKVKIAYIIGYTGIRQWDKYTSQISVLINLIAGQRYYIEALHKQGAGTDNLAVGWQLPDATMEKPIPGSRLSPFINGTNNPPSVSITSPPNNSSYSAPALITINANASDSDGSITKVEFYQGSTIIGTDISSPYSFDWTNVSSGTYSVTAVAYDNVGSKTTSSSITITVISSGNCSASGSITRELWNNVTGAKVISIPINQPPGSTSQMTLFEGPTNAGDNYGARYRGYLCVPITGSYTFWIASDDNSELWLSTNESPANKTLIASVTGYTKPREWEKYPSQKSVAINLVAGTQYYIEALHKEASGGDNIAVGWQLPDATLERPIPGIRLIPYSTSSLAKESYTNSETSDNLLLTLYPNPAKDILWIELKDQLQNDEFTTKQATINIYDIAGQSYNHTSWEIANGTNTIPIDITGFGGGVYFIKIEYNDSVLMRKVLIE